MKKKLWLFIMATSLLPIIGSSVTNAQEQFFAVGDTIQHRMLIGELPDSTLFSYEIGQLRLISQGSHRFLHFIDSTGTVENQYLKSESFTIATSSDSVRCSRFAFFDARQMPHDTDTYLTEAESDSAADAIHVLYASTEFRPASGYFSSSSVVRYILELRASSDNRVLLRADTLRCYLNPDGYLRYRTPGRTLNFVRVALPDMVDSQVYFVVRTESVLPGSTAFSYTGRETVKQRELIQNKLFAPIQQDIPTVAPKQGGKRPEFGSNLSLSLTEAYPTSVRKNFVLGLIADQRGTALIEILSVTGEIVHSEEMNLNSGFTRAVLDLSTLPTGSFQVQIISGPERISRKIQVIH